MYFIDTNIIVYANDRSAGEKQARCIEIVSGLMRRRQGVISVQVLQEYACTAIQKLKQPNEVVLRQIRLLESLRVVMPDPQLVIRAVEIQCRSQISFWDASIVAAAEKAACLMILSEDLNAGQYYADIPVQNPFNAGFKLEQGAGGQKSVIKDSGRRSDGG